jgi:hypothetical protein
MDISELKGPWISMIGRITDDEEIEKQEILDALASEDSVPDYIIKPFLREIISGEYKFKRGIQSGRYAHQTVWKLLTTGLVDELESWIKDTDQGHKQMSQGFQDLIDKLRIESSKPGESARTVAKQSSPLTQRQWLYRPGCV